MARMYYALQSVQKNSTPIYGIQSIGASEQFSTTPVFQLGQLGLYSSYSTDDNPVEITLTKQLDGRPLIHYYLNTMSPTDKLQFNFWDTAGQASGGTPTTPLPSRLVAQDWTITSASYTFEVGGVATEEVTIVVDGLTNDGATVITPAYMSTTITSPLDLATRSRVKEINGGTPGAGTQSVTFTYNNNLETIYTLGKFKAHERYGTVPSETTIEFVSNVDQIGTMGSTTSETIGGCSSGGGGSSGTTKSVELCDGTKVYANNAVSTSTTYSGGGTDGSPLVETASYTAYDSFFVVSP